MLLDDFDYGLPPELTPELRYNFIHYYFDIAWWGLYTGGTAAFLTIYAARVGATPAEIGLTGSRHVECPVTEFVVDKKRKIVSTPAYMLARSISEAAEGIGKLVKEVIRLI